MKNILRRWLLASVLCLLMTGTARAADTGYILCLRANAVLLCESDGAALPEGVETVYAPGGLYRTEDPAIAAELEKAGLLECVLPDLPLQLDDLPNDPACADGTQWELEMLHMDYAWQNGITGLDKRGQPVRVGILDSGIYAGHEDLAGANILPGTNYCAAADADPADTTDTQGHGTFVAGILAAAAGNGKGRAGLAPEIELVPLKCFSGKQTQLSYVLSAIYGAVDDYHCQVLNMSFSTMDNGSATTKALLRLLGDAVDHAAAQGAILVASAGNVSGTAAEDPVYYPAGFDAVISVGSVNAAKEHAAHSAKNHSLFITAPGQQVYSLGIASETSYTSGSGTSFAAPMVTAAAALARAVQPELSREALMCLLRDTAEDLGTTGYDPIYGWGLLDIGGLLARVQAGFYTYTEDGADHLAVRLCGLVPGETVRCVRACRSAQGAMTDVLLAQASVQADGSLWYALPLEAPPDGTVYVLVLDNALRPLREKWTP